MMIVADLHPLLHAAFKEAGFPLIDHTDGRLQIGDDSDGHWFVIEDDRVYTLTRESRGGDQVIIEVITTQVDALNRFLVQIVGPTLRRMSDRTALVTMTGEADLTGMTLERDDFGAVLLWSADGRTCRAYHFGREFALSLAHDLRHSIEDLLASYRSPDGSPVYPQGGRGLGGWRRR